MRPKTYLLLYFCFTLWTVYSQDLQELNIVSADLTWGKEVIQLPVEWAPGMDLSGFEELRFAPNRSDPESDQFWTLVMSWQVAALEPLSLSRIKDNLYAYFDGLMHPNHWAQEFPNPIILLTQDQLYLYSGTLKIFDGFYTGEVISLNLRGEQHYCDTKGKSIVVFRLSPASIDSEVWEQLQAIRYNEQSCN